MMSRYLHLDMELAGVFRIAEYARCAVVWLANHIDEGLPIRQDPDRTLMPADSVSQVMRFRPRGGPIDTSMATSAAETLLGRRATVVRELDVGNAVTLAAGRVQHIR